MVNKRMRNKATLQPEKILRLGTDFVPVPLHYYNLRSEVVGIGVSRWRKLRAEVLERQGQTCAICGALEKAHAHEVWQYTERKTGGIAKLVGIEILCSRCHYVQHWGLVEALAMKGGVKQEAVNALIQHFTTVNNCKRIEFDRHIRASRKILMRRNKLTWTVNWGDYLHLVKEAHAGKLPNRKVFPKGVRLKIPCASCANPITLAFPGGVPANKKKLGIVYHCENCKNIGELELPPGTMDVTIVKGAVALFSADSNSAKWAAKKGFRYIVMDS